MKPERIPSRIAYKFLDLWADEGWELYWKVTPRETRHR
jgi:hypothetical protein